MGLVEVKYVLAENLSEDEKNELKIAADEGLVAIEVTNPSLQHSAKLVDDYVEHLLSLADKPAE